MPRPSHLPDFAHPPLNEVVLGVQFAMPAGYQQIMAGEVWDLFKLGYPLVEERPALPPSFETFGMVTSPIMPFHFLSGGTQHTRFWFVSSDGSELLQFQGDRILHNWRKQLGSEVEYPRYERMIEKFEEQLTAFQSYTAKFGESALEINQCEISYVNTMPLDENTDFQMLADYLQTVRFDDPPPDLAINYRRIILDRSGAPSGRLHCEAQVVITPEGKPMATLNLTVRGRPDVPTIASVREYLDRGREKIILEFAAVTTSKAHALWERII